MQKEVSTSSYNPITTATKAGAPVVAILVLKSIVQWAGTHIGFDVDDDTSTKISVGFFGVVTGFINWWKNRKR